MRRRLKRAPRAAEPLFDLDHTLLPIDSDHAWGDFTVELGWVDAVDFARRQRCVLCPLPGRHARHPRLHRVRRRRPCAAGRPAPGRRARRFMREVIAAGDSAAGAGAGPRHQRARRHDRPRHGHQRLRHRADRRGLRHRDADRRPPRARRGRPAHRRDRRRAVVREGKVARVGQWLAERGLGWDDFERISVLSAIRPTTCRCWSGSTDPVATNPDARSRSHCPRSRLAHPGPVRT